MKFSLVLCTYMRPDPLLRLLESVRIQDPYPDEIIIVDGSLNDDTQFALQRNAFINVKYFLVEKNERGLTKQRNFGIRKVNPQTEVVFFLDDDTVLESGYFNACISTYKENSNVVGVGGLAINENRWSKAESIERKNRKHYFYFENFVFPEGLRNIARNYLRLQSDLGPGRMPEFSHGRTCGFPLTGKTYEVDLLIGMSFSFRKKVVDAIKFSNYFEGYGLYEDADYSIRAQQFGVNVINTNAKLNHYHDPAGRPDKFKYGKMVVRNGWYVWRVKYPNPSFKAKIKWHLITLLLIVIRLTNILNTSKRIEAFNESIGRTLGWLSLFVTKPLK